MYMAQISKYRKDLKPMSYLTDPGKARGCFTNTVVIDLISMYVTLFYPHSLTAPLSQSD